MPGYVFLTHLHRMCHSSLKNSEIDTHCTDEKAEAQTYHVTFLKSYI